MTTIEELRKTYYEHGKKAGEVNRQLALAGVAVIWIFKSQATSAQSSLAFTLPQGLFFPILLLLLSLGLDLLQYVWQAALWGAICRIEEKKQRTNSAQWKGIRPILNWPGLALFWGKFAATMASYVFLLRFLMSRVMFT